MASLTHGLMYSRGSGAHRIGGDLVGSRVDLDALERGMSFPRQESNHSSSGIQPFEFYVLLMVWLPSIACITGWVQRGNRVPESNSLRRPVRIPVSVPTTLACYRTRQSLHRARQQIRQGQNQLRIKIIIDIRPSMNYSSLSSNWNSTVPHSATSAVCECLLEHNVPVITNTVYHKRRLQDR